MDRRQPEQAPLDGADGARREPGESRAGLKPVADALLAVEGTRARNVKVSTLAAALAEVARREPSRLPFVARFLTGTLLPTQDERTLGVGGALLCEATSAAFGVTPSELGTMARRAGDLGTAVGEAAEAHLKGLGAPETLGGSPNPSAEDPVQVARGHVRSPVLQGRGLFLDDAEEIALELAASGSRAEKLRALCLAFEACSPVEVRYFVRALLGEMRVGAREGIVEDAVARAFARPLSDVRRASGLVTDVGELARLAFEDRLDEARVMIRRPIGFMLATPIEVARGADLSVPHVVEDKIDGIRAQAHVSAEGVRLFARGKGSVTAAFPDVTQPLIQAARAGRITTAILDGEIIVVTPDGKPRPFSAIQARLGRTAPDDELMRNYPAAYLVYDVLFERDEPLMALPFSERRARLIRWAVQAPAPLAVHDSRPLVISGEGSGGPTNEGAAASIHPAIDVEFATARARGFEGLVLKRLDAMYTAGVRGFAWLKVKKALATLDVVIVAAERGHGRRAGVLSDYTFSVRDGAELKTIGKAYSGLTDAEIGAMSERLRSLALAEEDRGLLAVRPEIVLEVAFDGLHRSNRHSSGFALRFPRIARIRDDKAPEEADTLDAVRAIWEAQLASGHREDLVAGERKPETKGGRRSGRRPDIRQKGKQLKLFED